MASNDGTAVAPVRLSTPALLGFSMPGLCIGALGIALTVYLPRQYAGHFGLGLPAVGLAFMIVRLVDVLIDPLIGIAMDHTRTRLGRYRIWLAAGAPVLMAAVYMLFDPPGGVSYGYLLGWLFIYYIGTSLILLSHAAWASVVAAAYDERSRVFGAIQFISLIGAVAALVLPIVMARRDGSSGAGDVAAMGVFIVAATPLGAILALVSTPERLAPRDAGQGVTARDYWDMISRPDMARILIADFCLALGPGWMSALYLFYFHDARGFSVGAASLLLLIYVVAGIPGSMALSWAATQAGADSDDAAHRFRHDAARRSDLMPPTLGRSVGGE